MTDSSETTSSQRDASTSSTSEGPSGSGERIVVSHHAELRWLQRGREFDCPLPTAWQRAQQIELVRPDTGFSEVRYDAATGCLLCARDDTLTTVLNAENEPVRPPSENQVARCAGCSRPREDTTSPCSECGVRPVVTGQSPRDPLGGGAQ